MSLTFGLSPLVLLALLLAAGGAAWWVYRITVPLLPVRIRIVLATLRFLALGTILFLLAEPLLRRVASRTELPVVAVLVDASASMALSPESGSDVDHSSAADTRLILDDLENRLTGAAVRWYAFGADLEESDPDSIRFGMGRTDMAGAMVDVQDRLLGEGLTGVILISDGRSNTGRNPLTVAERYPVPVHTIVVGDTVSHSDLQVRRILTNDLAYKGRELPFEATIRQEGFAGRTVSVALQEDGRTVDRASVTLPEADGATTVRLSATPFEVGLRRYSIVVNELEGELTARNNVASAVVQVLESERRVLIVSSGPSPDLSSLRGILEGEEDLVVETRVQKNPTEFYEGPLPDPDLFDLIVLAGYPGSGAAMSDVDRLARAAADGKALLFFLDRGTDQQALSRMGSALPATPVEIRNGFVEARVLPTSDGRRHPVLTPPEPPPVDPWSILPPLFVSDSRWTVSPDAQVMAVSEIRGIRLDDPVFVTRRRSGARSAAFLAQGYWRWGNLPGDLDRVADAWPATMERLVQWLVAPEDDRPVRVRPVSPSFEGGTVIEFTGQVYDEALVPVRDAAIEVDVTTPDGRNLPYTLGPVGEGRYAGSLGVLPEGTYSYAARGVRAEVELGRDSGSFSVGPLSVEFMDPGSDPALMRQVAVRSGGVAVDSGSSSSLVDSLARRGLLRPALRTAETSFRLWQRYPFLIMVLVLLTAEWFLRKRRGLV